jgi:hypothetical protein
MKKSQLKALIRETIEEVQSNGIGPEGMVALKSKKDGHWKILSIFAWQRGGMLDVNPKNYDAYLVSDQMYDREDETEITETRRQN